MDLDERHKQEKKELQARIQKIKHATPKGDKKRQKETKDEIARLEAELREKHAREIEGANEIEKCEQKLAAVNIVSNAEANGSTAQTKKSKATKRREKKEREEREREARIAEGKLESLTGSRHVEQQLITAKLSGRKLSLYDIASDGDCLYNAVAHQMLLRTNQPAMSVSELRGKVADEMRNNRDEYLPFLTTADGDMLDEQGFLNYCDKLQNSPEWGGHVEIKALTAILNYPMLVIQADLPDILVEKADGKSSEPLIVVYHKHLYELGEHYSSVIPLNATKVHS